MNRAASGGCGADAAPARLMHEMAAHMFSNALSYGPWAGY